MIDRKTLHIMLLLVLAMAAAAAWRLSLLPDWHRVPMLTPYGMVMKNSLVLFGGPIALLFTIAVALACNWLVSGPDAAVQLRQRRSRLILLGSGVLVLFMQALLISRSLGHDLGLDAETPGRALMLVSGILTTLYGNSLPKMPRVAKRFAVFNLDPWQSARCRRFLGLLTVGFGIAMMAGAALLPMRAMMPTVLTLCVAYYAAFTWHFIQLKREPALLTKMGEHA